MTTRLTSWKPNSARRTRRPEVEGLEVRDLPAASPLAITAGLGSGSDPDGNGVVVRPVAAIIGHTAPGALVRLERGEGGFDRATRANGRGNYRFLVDLPIGRTTFHVQARDRAGDRAAAEVMATRGDCLIDWNTSMLVAVQVGKSSPPMVARDLAMVQVAMYDAIDSITKEHALYGSGLPTPARGTSAVAAASEAAYVVAKALYPQQAGTFAATLSETLGTVTPGVARARGIAFGQAMGNAILALRANDGANANVPYVQGSGPGVWVPTPPAFAAPLAVQFARVTPFAMTSPSQFLPPPPPALDGAGYAAEYNQVKALGAVNSTVRTPDQTVIAHFWSDLVGTTFTPAGHWNQIAQDAALQSRMSLSDEAHLFADLDVALADAGIASWNSKNVYNRWRPVTAIRAGNDGINSARLAADPTWTPLWSTPAFQSYTSGHSAFSGAAQVVLESFFGTHYSFTDRGAPTLVNVPPRHFDSFVQAANEAGMSRIYGGIHFLSDNLAGLAQGRSVGNYVLQTVMK